MFTTEEGHGYILRTCLVYLRCKELQLAWLGPASSDEFGMLRNDHETRFLLDTRLRDHKFLLYSAFSWAYHLVCCGPNVSTDLLDIALDFLTNHQTTSDSCFQLSEYMAVPDKQLHWPPGTSLHATVRARSFLLVERYLNREQVDVNATTLTGCTALMEVCVANPLLDASTQSEQIFQLLLEHGSDEKLLTNITRQPCTGQPMVGC